MKKIFFSVGELSGDIHTAKVIEEINKLTSDTSIFALGGNNMKNQGAKLIHHISETSFMGFSEVIRHLPQLRQIWKNTLHFLKTEKPDLVVLVDYPGFNLRLAKACYKINIPVVYYISPQVWAWHQSRSKKIKKYTKALFCIQPFEEDWFKKRDIKATFVGNPLMDEIFSNDSSLPDLKHPDSSHLIGLFPGSRLQETENHFPIMVEAVKILKKEFPKLEAHIAVAPGIAINKYKEQYPMNWLKWTYNRNQDLMRQSDFLFMSSGTATLEAAIANTPMTVIYKVSPLTYWLGKKLIKVPFISLPNLIGEKEGVTELIQHEANAVNLANEALTILKSKIKELEMRNFLKNVTNKLGKPGASARVAKKIIDFL